MSINQNADAGTPLRPPSRAPTAYPAEESSEDRLELALRQAQTNLLRYQELFDFAPDGYLVTDLHAVIVEANHAAAAMLGGRKDLLTDKPLYCYVDKPDRRSFTDQLTQVLPRAPRHVQWQMRLCPPRRTP